MPTATRALDPSPCMQSKVGPGCTDNKAADASARQRLLSSYPFDLFLTQQRPPSADTSARHSISHAHITCSLPAVAGVNDGFPSSPKFGCFVQRIAATGTSVRPMYEDGGSSFGTRLRHEARCTHAVSCAARKGGLHLWPDSRAGASEAAVDTDSARLGMSLCIMLGTRGKRRHPHAPLGRKATHIEYILATMEPCVIAFTPSTPACSDCCRILDSTHVTAENGGRSQEASCRSRRSPAAPGNEQASLHPPKTSAHASFGTCIGQPSLTNVP